MYWNSRLENCTSEFALFGSSASVTSNSNIVDKGLGSIVLQQGKLQCTQEVKLDAETAALLEAFINKHCSILRQDVFLFIYAVLLFRYCQQEELVIFCQNMMSDLPFRVAAPVTDESALSWLDNIRKLFGADFSNLLPLGELMTSKIGPHLINAIKQYPAFHYFEAGNGIWSKHANYISTLGLDITSTLINCCMYTFFMYCFYRIRCYCSQNVV